VQQIWQVLVADRIVFILSLIPVSVFCLLVRNSIVSYLDLWIIIKKLSLFFLQYGQISCVSNKFLVGSVIWDNKEYFLTFQRQYVCIVSGKWDNTNTVFLGIQILRQYSVLGDTCIVLPLLHCCFELGGAQIFITSTQFWIRFGVKIFASKFQKSPQKHFKKIAKTMFIIGALWLHRFWISFQ
jgi:hypothetical protein